MINDCDYVMKTLISLQGMCLSTRIPEVLHAARTVVLKNILSKNRNVICSYLTR